MQQDGQDLLATQKTLNEPSGIYHLQEGKASPALSLLPDAIVLEKLSLLPTSLVIWELLRIK